MKENELLARIEEAEREELRDGERLDWLSEDLERLEDAKWANINADDEDETLRQTIDRLRAAT